MKPIAAVALAALVPLAALAQEADEDGTITVAPLPDGADDRQEGSQSDTPPGLVRLPDPDAAPERPEVAQAPGAVVRALDRPENRIRDIPLQVGESARFGDLEIRLAECRAPVDNPAGDAFA